MKKLFAAASGIFGSIPGISIMWSGLGTPPGYAKIFGGVIQAFGALSILLLLANKERLRHLKSRKATLAVILLACSSLALLVIYIQLLTLTVVSHPIHGTVYYPLWSGGHALEMIDRAGGRYAAIDHYGSYPVNKAVHEAPNYAMSSVTTTVLLVLVYQGIFTTLTLAFGLTGLRDDKALVEIDAAGMIPMRAIFISYRRDDSEGHTGRLYDDLARQFGDRSVFMDVVGVEPGLDFRKVIDNKVSSCGVLLAVIGPGWVDAKDESGHRRLDNPMDFVRLETASALKRGIPVVPVLVHGARMPKSEQLPDDLMELAYRNALELTHARWDSDIELLIKALQRHVNDEKSKSVDVRVESQCPKRGQLLL